MIRVLAVALTTILGGGAQPAVCEVGKPAIPEAPSQMAFSNDVQDGRDGGRDDGRDQDYNGKYARPEEHALSSDEEDEKGEKEVKVQGKKSDQGDEDDVRPEVTSDVAINLPAPSTAAAGASLMAAASAATSSPVASPADASSTATDPAFSAPTAVPSATTPESANPSVVPRPAAEPAAVRPVPVAGLRRSVESRWPRRNAARRQYLQQGAERHDLRPVEPASRYGGGRGGVRLVLGSSVFCSTSRS